MQTVQDAAPTSPDLFDRISHAIGYGFSHWYLGLFIILVIIAFFTIMGGINIVDQWERRPVLRFGRYVKTGGPGFFYAIPFVDKVLDAINVNQEVETFKVSDIRTHDNVPIQLNVVITSIIASEHVQTFTLSVYDGIGVFENRIVAAVTECVTKSELDAILHTQQVVCSSIKTLLQSRVGEWGIDIVAVEISNISITDTMISEAISMKARASKEADAELVRAEKQIQIVAALKLAADTMDEQVWRYKGLEVLVELTRSGENNTVLMFPSELTALLSSALGGGKKA